MSKKLRTRLASALSAVIIPVTLVCSSVPALAAGTAGNPVADTAAAESSESADKALEASESSLELPEITRALEEMDEAPAAEAPAEEKTPAAENKTDEAPAAGTPVCAVTTGVQSRQAGADVTYATLKEAFDSIEEGQTATITLTGNAVVEDTIVVHGNVTLTANGDYTVSLSEDTSSRSFFTLYDENQLTVDGAGHSITLTVAEEVGGIINVWNDSVLSLKAGTTLENCSINAKNNAALNIIGAAVTGTSDGENPALVGVSDSAALKATGAALPIVGILNECAASFDGCEVYGIGNEESPNVKVQGSTVGVIQNGGSELLISDSSVDNLLNVMFAAQFTLSGKTDIAYIMLAKKPIILAEDFSSSVVSRVYTAYPLIFTNPAVLAEAESGALSEAADGSFCYQLEGSMDAQTYAPYLKNGRLETAKVFETYVSVNLEHNSYPYTGRDPQAEGGLGKVTITVTDEEGREITPAEGKLTTTYTHYLDVLETPPTQLGDYTLNVSYAGEENRADQTLTLGSSGTASFIIGRAELKGDFADFPSEISVSQGSVRADFRPAEGIDAALLKLNYTWTLTDEDGAATTVPGDTLELTKADIGKTAQVSVEDTSGFYYGEITSSPFTVGRVATGVRIDGLSYDSDSNYFESNDALQALLTKDNAVIVTYLDPEGHKNIAYDKDEISLKYDSVDDGMLLDRAPTEPGTYSLNVAFTPNDAHQAQDLQATSVSYTYTLMMPTTTEINASALKGSYDVSDIQSLEKDLKKATTVRDKDGKAIKLDQNSGLLSFEAYTDAEGKNIAQTPAAGTYYVRAFYNRDGQEKAHIASSSELVKITLTQKAGPDSGTTADTTTGTTPGNPATGTPYSAGLSLVLLAALAGGSVLVLKKRS
ncbi:hypothetical protein [Eubacterium limosum]|jgi:hypothetical protein|uniref:Cell surface protein n=1 Tax=Eubacterium limosum TaxID=1736 RepID=A0AAC9QR57_EUBLI|nr:hypothetical protein [Eubacterium limosum]ARD64194.1 hypothetical protein B2M23_00900 [Eubacterium limosum]PWW60039.1 hypothetical protein C7955_101440 [Eubacterium limosum]UQZ21823.1 hypothetical protein M5595_16560 [Eubacterium limosum]